MSNTFKEALNDVYNEIISIDEDTFKKELEKHEESEIASILIETGALKDIKDYGESFEKISYDNLDEISLSTNIELGVVNLSEWLYPIERLSENLGSDCFSLGWIEAEITNAHVFGFQVLTSACLKQSISIFYDSVISQHGQPDDYCPYSLAA